MWYVIQVINGREDVMRERIERVVPSDAMQEIWFAAKTPEGPSTLYSLSDIADIDGKRIRTQNAYDRQYLAGRYGADPYLRSMLEWGGCDEQ